MPYSPVSYLPAISTKGRNLIVAELNAVGASPRDRIAGPAYWARQGVAAAKSATMLVSFRRGFIIPKMLSAHSVLREHLEAVKPDAGVSPLNRIPADAESIIRPAISRAANVSISTNCKDESHTRSRRGK